MRGDRNQPTSPTPAFTPDPNNTWELRFVMRFNEPAELSLACWGTMTAEQVQVLRDDLARAVWLMTGSPVADTSTAGEPT
jgi:hypothetical protein